MPRLPTRASETDRPTHRHPLACAAAAALLTLLSCGAIAGEASPRREAYRFGVFPYVPALTIDRIFGPAAAQLAEDIGRPIRLKTKSTFEQFAEELRQQSYDIILVHPFLYIEAHDRHDYQPVARLDARLSGIVMVRADDPATRLEDLTGRTIALPPTLSAISTLVKAALLAHAMVPGTDVTLEHYRSKVSCLHALAIGRADACALPRFILARIESLSALDLRELFETAAINHFVFAVHARVTAVDRERLYRSILSWPSTARGRAILAGGAWTRFLPATDEDYDDARRYISRLQTLAQR